tara:strand:- start:3950 stop:4351 length:402 start_codon:yes stop_codon:yes gene_type:complete
MKYLKSFNENTNGLPTYDDKYLHDSKRKLALINGIVKLILDNTKKHEVVYLSKDVFIDNGWGKEVKVYCVDYHEWDKECRICYYGDHTMEWISILELNYEDLKKILSYLITYNDKIGKYTQSITDGAFKKINQ